ncbi:MAG: glucan biosynthesis protein [Alphaproteobacteria bacterium]|nr:glucan biosynthesis protein D [Alphaproteobacteria bacterium]MDE2013574.1 glucan biosynthesis protein [Alphaproteobacteria bacterium]
MMTVDRRMFLMQSLFLAATAGAGSARAAAPAHGLTHGLKFGRARPFSYARLRAHAKAMARSAYRAAVPPAAALVQGVDFDVSQKIRFRPEDALWHGKAGHLPIAFFHLTKFNNLPVAVNAVQGGEARRVLYRPGYFDYGATGFAQKLPANLGFSGFRVMDGADAQTDWLAFQGASYFRSAGQQGQYGASARGIAVDTAMATREEFPRFTEFWIDETPSHDEAVTIYALLDGPSITGAYRFVARRAVGVVIDVQADLFLREDVRRLGVAPLTSMYWYSDSNYWQRTDWRPAIHDSDGLALWTGKGERIWRPLNDPPSVQVNTFVDTNPKGFGLMQRDRNFAHYLDDGAFYNRRPSIWVEPLAPWGEGGVQLVEIPTDDEIHDNIVAYWLPKAPANKGTEMSLSYRLYWQDYQPHPPADIAEVIATRVGRGGVPGQPVPHDKRKFVVDFEGGTLATMAPRYDITPVVSLSRGKVDHAYVIKVVGTSTWRAFFDVAVNGTLPLDMRCYLRLGDRTLSETWLYQYFPHPLA